MWKGEIEFVRNYFTHNQWIYQPAIFRFDGTDYSPDFYDIVRKVFIEVVANHSAISIKKKKLKEFHRVFPDIKLELRKSDGTILEQKNGKFVWTSKD